MKNIKPISPNLAKKEAKKQNHQQIPNEIIEVFNEILIKEIYKNEIVIYQDDIVKKITKKMNIKSDLIFANNWLDIEDIYLKQGWNIDYDKPGYNETYRSYWVFKPKK